MAAVSAFVFTNSITAHIYAESADTETTGGLIEITDDTLLENAELISETSSVFAGRITTVKTYELSDGTTVTDTFETGLVLPLSPNGSDTATRTRQVSDWGSVTLTAHFSWWTLIPFAYVECTRASASRNLKSGVVVSGWNLTKTQGASSLGTAYAEIYYAFYSAANPIIGISGRLRITCTDTGRISDNG